MLPNRLNPLVQKFTQSIQRHAKIYIRAPALILPIIVHINDKPYFGCAFSAIGVSWFSNVAPTNPPKPETIGQLTLAGRALATIEASRRVKMSKINLNVTYLMNCLRIKCTPHGACT